MCVDESFVGFASVRFECTQLGQTNVQTAWALGPEDKARVLVRRPGVVASPLGDQPDIVGAVRDASVLPRVATSHHDRFPGRHDPRAEELSGVHLLAVVEDHLVT